MSTSDWIQLGTLVVSIAVGAVIGWYTVETTRLRREAQRQNDQAVMPIVALEPAMDWPWLDEGANIGSHKVALRNVGLGAGFNIEIDSLKGPGAAIRFHTVTTLAAGDRQPVMMSVVESGKDAHGHAYGLIQRMFHGYQLGPRASLVIRYGDVHGKRYETTMVFDYDTFTKELTLRLEKMNLEKK